MSETDPVLAAYGYIRQLEAKLEAERSENARLVAASDEMFSDDAVERAAEALYNVRYYDATARLVTKTWADLDEEMKPFYRKDVRAVIAALRSEV